MLKFLAMARKRRKRKQKSEEKQIETRQTETAVLPIASILFPLFLGVVAVAVTNGWGTAAFNTRAIALPFFAAIGISSWFLGMRWFGLGGLGLRGGRPLFAGIGFAVLGWVALFIVRIVTVRIASLESGFREFAFFLLFEGFAVQLWIFGLVFRAISNWRGPLTAAAASGVLFSTTAFLFFQEPSQSDLSSLVYFLVWGLFYGIIRLRTGSFIGVAIVQAIQSFTVWVALTPLEVIEPSQLRTLHWITAVLFAIFIWRLWPKQEEDYRV
ncbi:MAG: hypothetical protein AAF614_33035 [Chloroflexota bacterium]